MKTILVLILAVHLVVAAGEHCPGVKSMSVEGACREACGTRLMHDMCMDTLRGGFDPDPSRAVEVTAYALLAAQRAVESYLATADAALKLLSGSLDGDERKAYDACVVDYGYAETSMYRVINGMLPQCMFGGLADEYMNGVLHLESCRDRLMWLAASPVYPMNLVDRNKQLLAYSLGQLLGLQKEKDQSILLEGAGRIQRSAVATHEMARSRSAPMARIEDVDENTCAGDEDEDVTIN